MRHLLILFSLLYHTSPIFSQSEGKITQQIDGYILLDSARTMMSINTDSAFVLAQEAEQMASKQGLPDVQAQSAQLLGQLFFVEAAYNQALEYFLKAEKIWQSYHNPSQRAANFNDLGQLYSQLKRPDKVLYYHQAALHIYQKLQDIQETAGTYGHVGHYFEKKEMYDSALFYQYRALALYDSASYGKGKSLILENLGSIYEDLEEYALAEQFFKQSLELNGVFEDPSSRARILNNLGDVSYKTQHFPEAFTYMQEALTLAKEQQDQYQIRSVYRDLAQLFAAQHLHQLAYQYLDSSVILYKQIYSEDGLRQVARLETFFGADMKNREIALLEKDRRISQLVFFLIAAGLSLIIILALLLISRQRMKLQQSTELYDTQHQLMQVQKHNNMLAEQQLKNELDSKSRSLTTYTLHLIEKNQLLKQVKSELKEIDHADSRYPKKVLRNLSKDIDFNLSRDHNWDDFRKNFEEVHPAFFKKLVSRIPGLSQAELKLAALMKMRMSSTDIAAMMGISTNSLRIARYRLRKKLELDKAQKLNTFLQTI